MSGEEVAADSPGENEVESQDSKEEYGCVHYKCRCAYVAPCCSKIYTCRLCHDEKESHEINRFEVSEIVCLVCSERQPVQKNCTKCNTQFGNYFCGICRLFDDTDKQQYHCHECGLCRVGGRENFFHCKKCDMCLSTAIANHKCIEKVTRSNCPVCMEDLHTSRLNLNVLDCGHICHRSCMNQMLETGNYSCPLCCTTMCDMSRVWESLDQEIRETPMPEEYKDTKHWILCRDCHETSEAKFHVFGLKCARCGSYNTCGTSNPNPENKP